MTKFIDLNEIRRAWASKYGAASARAMMAGAAMAYDSRYGRDQSGTHLLPTGRRMTPGQEEGESDFRGRDQEQEQDPGLEQVKTFLKNRLSPEDFARLEQLIEALSNGGKEDDDDQPNHRADPSSSESSDPYRNAPQPARDNPAPFKGMPQPGGGKQYAQDARGNSYFDMFGDNAKVDVNDYGRR